MGTHSICNHTYTLYTLHAVESNGMNIKLKQLQNETKIMFDAKSNETCRCIRVKFVKVKWNALKLAHDEALMCGSVRAIEVFNISLLLLLLFFVSLVKLLCFLFTHFIQRCVSDVLCRATANCFTHFVCHLICNRSKAMTFIIATSHMLGRRRLCNATVNDDDDDEMGELQRPNE